MKLQPEHQEFSPDNPTARLEDFTQTIQRKKEREMADLQFVGGDGST